jgi:hypothetical protein
MRWGPIFVLSSLLAGVGPARAQDAGAVPVYPVQAPAKHKTAGAAKKPTPKPDAKNEAAKPATAKPAAAPAAPALAGAPKKEPPKADTAKPAPAKPEPAISKTAKVEPPPSRAERDDFAGIPPAERLKIQQALLWSGDYPGAAASSEPLLTAIKNFQKRSKAKVTGVLTPTERAALVAAADTHEEEFGWSVVIDPATGIRIGLPTKLVPLTRDAARGTRWSSKHGDVQVETFRIKDPNLKLSDLFDKEKKEPAARRVETSVLHDDNFFISGMQGLKKFAVRAQMRNGEVRGFTMLFDQMMETIVAPVMVAMSSAFAPFPEHSMPYATLAKRVEYGTGLLVSAQGHIITDRNLTKGCEVIVAAGLGHADRIADSPDSGMALLRVYGPRKVSPLQIGQDAPSAGDLTLVGVPDPNEQNGNQKLTEIKARLDGSAIELRQPVPMAGFTGAAALDGQGHFLGMMQMRNFVVASAEPSAPPVRLVTAKTIRDFLAAHDVKPAAAPSADPKAAVVRVICVRK